MRSEQPQTVEDAHASSREEAAHEKRNWVRLTFECNNRCTFCLDSRTHTGEMRDRHEVKSQILEGRARGATRLVLSGGEPTLHPSFVDFVKLGRLAGYSKIQTVTNGRLFGYPAFLQRSLEAGLSEITFSLHGPNAQVHDALVGAPGAFEQASRGLRAALADGRAVVNVDSVINRANVEHLPRMLELFVSWGVRELDLLQLVPFGRAFAEGRETLFYDLEQMRPYLLEAFAYSKRPDLHLWLNRFPPEHLEGYERLIQDPYKLNDEVRGRKEEFALLLDHGIALDCREPERCRHCYLNRLCDALDSVRALVAERRFERVRVDARADEEPVSAFGGDPASARRAKTAAPASGAVVSSPLPVPVEQLVEEARPRTLQVVAPDVEAALGVLARFPGVPQLELELDDYSSLAAALARGQLGSKRLIRARAATVDQARGLLDIDGDFEVLVALSRHTGPWLLGLDPLPSRLALVQPTHERLSGSAGADVDLPAFFARFLHPVPVEGVPACITGRPPRAPPATLDAAMLAPDGRLEIFRFTKAYIREHYLTRSLRCAPCAHAGSCRGLHVNHVRAHGYAAMRPVEPQR